MNKEIAKIFREMADLLNIRGDGAFHINAYRKAAEYLDRLNVDVSEIMTNSVNIDTGATSMKLTLGDKTTFDAVSIDAGASSLTINLPKTLGAKLIIDSGLTSKDLPDFNKIDDKTYETANYGSTEKKTEITLKLGVSSLKVNWK